jgi:hypothetical protein
LIDSNRAWAADIQRRTPDFLIEQAGLADGYQRALSALLS